MSLKALLDYVLRKQPWARMVRGRWEPLRKRGTQSHGYDIGPFPSVEACEAFCRHANAEPQQVRLQIEDPEEATWVG